MATVTESGGSLPEVQNIRRYRYRSGDRIIIRILENTDQITGESIIDLVSATLGVPSEHILLFKRGSDIKVMREVKEDE